MTQKIVEITTIMNVTILWIPSHCAIEAYWRYDVQYIAVHVQLSTESDVFESAASESTSEKSLKQIVLFVALLLSSKQYTDPEQCQNKKWKTEKCTQVA